jgi:four helix bundle protein
MAKAHRFVLTTYSLTARFPRSEIYCLSSQMRRAAISVPANIAEGFKKRGVSDKTRLLNFAQGSLEECRYYLILIQDLGYGATADMEAILEEVSKLLLPTRAQSSATGEPLKIAELLKLLTSAVP